MGLQMDDPSDLAAQQGLLSQRTVQQLLDHWKTKLSCHDLLLPTSPTTTVVEEKPSPAIFLALDPLGKTLYKMLGKTTNRRRLNQRTDTPWRRYFGLAPDCRPQWRVLYKPPLSKRPPLESPT
ncbi:hypothetical protein D4764_07G0000970 [Takifugu flavidus]|uniref:Uncharacterized protein n=1 Tax=Takifugu flavidus TaxID=433684 RepID=A0A5C6MSR4_9TELE|nr:hypothetical protein D4764_07G0000970 [Takifugu flavidus]